MHCRCVHDNNSPACRAIECPAYLWVMAFSRAFIRRFAKVARLIFLAGLAFACTDQRRGGSALDEFWARPLPEAPQVVYFGHNKPSLATMQRLAVAAK